MLVGMCAIGVWRDKVEAVRQESLPRDASWVINP
jgi:hypothetical protein